MLQSPIRLASACALLSMAPHVSCARSAPNPDSPQVVSVALGALLVPGAVQAGGALVLTLPVHNAGTDHVAIADIRLFAASPVLTFQPEVGNPVVLEANSTAQWEFRVTAQPGAEPSRITMFAKLWVSTRQGGLRKVQSDGSVGVIDVVALAGAGTAAATLTSNVDRVAAYGQYALRLTVVNASTADVTLDANAAVFSFTSAGIPVEAYVSSPTGATLSGGAAVTVTAGTMQTLDYSVRLGQLVSGPTVMITVDVPALFADGSSTSVHAAASWATTLLADLLVTTPIDADDTNGVFTLAAAGGAADLSLREALLLANASAEPTHIRFDPMQFLPTGPPTAVVIDSALGSLPELTLAGTWLDGDGAGVMIIDTFGGPLPLLRVAANQVHLSHLILEQFAGKCLVSRNSDGLLLHDLTLSNCGAASVSLVGGVDHQILDNRFLTNTGGDQLLLSGTSRNAVISGNNFVAANGHCIHVTGYGHQILGNTLLKCRTGGIRLYAARSILISDNTVFDSGNRGYGQQNASVLVNTTSADVRIERNTFGTEREYAIGVVPESTNVTMTQNVFTTHHTWPVLDVPAPVDGGVAPPTVTEVNASSIRGQHATEGARIEIYHQVPGGSTTWIGDAIASGGSWEFLSLQNPIFKVIATATTSLGTSAFSSPAYATTASLVVTTNNDELDGGQQIFTVDAAGGVTDLSLREAMQIANNREGPDTITFSATTFPVGALNPIRLTPLPLGGLGVLPHVSDAELTLDGTGAEIVIDGASQLFSGAAALRVGASDVAIRALRVQNFAGVASLVSGNVFGARLLIEEVGVECGAMAGTGIAIFNGRDARIARVEVSRCATGIQLGVSVTNTQMIDSNLHDMRTNCVGLNEALGTGIYDSTLSGCGRSGILIRQSGPTEIVGNTIWGTPLGIEYVDGLASDNPTTFIAFNTLVENGRAIHHLIDADFTAVHNNIIAHNTNFGMTLTDVDWDASHNLFFDNGADGASGANAIEGLLPTDLDPDDILADPQLSDRASEDFTPKAAVFDAGVDVGFDRNGLLAPGNFDGTAPDVGASEIL